MSDDTMEEPQKASLPVTSPPENVSGIAIAERRLLEAKSLEEAIVWTQIRGEIQKQDRLQQEFQHSEKRSRQREILDLVRQFAFLGAGIGLIVTGHGWIGGFLAAAAAYPMAKEFVMEKFPKISLPGGGHQDES